MAVTSKTAPAAITRPSTPAEKPPNKYRLALPQYAAVSPFFILFAIFGAFPVLFSIWISFHSWDGIGQMKWVGLEQYHYLLSDATFWKTIGNTLIIWVLSTVPMLLLALVIANALHNATRFRTFYRIAYFIPNVTSLVAMAIFFSSIFSTNFGLVNAALRSLGIPQQDWLGQPWGIKIAISTMIVWQWVGYNTLIYLAGLQAIPKDQYEAAKVDGAGAVRTFFAITLPQLRPVVLFTVVMSTIGGLQTFTEPQVMVGNSGGTGQSGMTVVLFFYRAAFLDNDYGYAAAIALSIFMLVLLFTAINWRIFRTRGDNQ